MNNLKINNLEIKVVDVVPKELNLEEYKLRSALESDFKTIYNDSVIIRVNGVPKVIYLDLDKLGYDATPITTALRKINYHTSDRSGGLMSTSRIFGYAPRVVMRKDFCSATSLVNDFPKEHKVVCDYAELVSEIYSQIDPDIYAKHRQEADKVLADWRIEDSPFTSGIINKNNPLKYHFDTGNFKDVYSCMLGFKHNVSGGYLACPQYDCAFEIKNNSLHIFDGQGILHGVTPFKLMTEDAYRFTVVYYSLKAMWSCLPLDDELLRIRKVKTKREQKRAKGLDKVPESTKELDAEAFKGIR